MATRTIANGGGNWNLIGTWVEGAVPTSADDVIATATSGNLTINAASSCRSIDLTSYIGTLTHQAFTLSVGDASGGALKYVTGMGYSVTSATSSLVSFASTSTNSGSGWAVDFGGKTIGPLSFIGVGGKWVLQTNTTFNSASTLTLSGGELDTASKSIVGGSINISGSASTRVFTPGSSAMTFSATTPWTGGNSAALTVTANTAIATFTAASGTSNVGANVLNGLSFAITGSGIFALTTTAGFSIGNLTRTGTAALTDGMTVNGAVIVTGNLTLNGNSTVNRLKVTSSSSVIQTITCNGIVSVSYANIENITGAGLASFNVASATGGSGDLGGNTTWTFTTPATQYWVGHTGTWGVAGNWGTSSGGSGGRIPLPQDTAVFDTNSFNASSQTVTLTGPFDLSAIDTTTVTNNPTLDLNTSGSTYTVYGNFLAINCTITAGVNAHLTLGGRSSYTFSSTGTIPSVNLNFCPFSSCSYTLGTNLTTLGILTVTTGTFDSSNHNMTASTFTFFGTEALGTSIISTTASSGTVFTENGGVDGDSASFIILTSSTSTRSFTGINDKVYGSLTYNVVDSPGSLALTSRYRFGNLTIGAGRNLILSGVLSADSFTMNGADRGYFVPTTLGLTSPHHTDFDITGDLDLIASMRAFDWSPTSSTNIISKDTSSSLSYRFRISTTGALVLDLSVAGTTFTSSTSSVTVGSVGITDNMDQWVRVTRRQSDGRIQFFYGTDGSTWTQLGTNITGTTSSIFAGTSDLLIGQSHQVNTNFNGRIYRAIVKSGIAGTAVADLDFSTWPATTNTMNDAASTPKSWTVNDPVGDGRVVITGSANGIATDYVDGYGYAWRQNSQTDTTYNGYVSASNAQWLSTVGVRGATPPSLSALNVTGDLDVSCFVRSVDWTPSSIGYLATKGGSASDLSWRFSISTTGRLVLAVTGNGSTTRTATSSVSTGVTDATDSWVRCTYSASTGNVLFYLSSDGLSWTQLGTTQSVTSGALFVSSGALYFGRGETSSLNFSGRLYRMVLRNGIGGTILADVDYSNRNLQVFDRVEVSSVPGIGGGNWYSGNGRSTGTNPGWTFVAGTPIFSFDSGSGADAGTVAALLSSADSGSGLEATSFAITSSDTGSGLETAIFIGIPVFGSDTGHGTEANSLSTSISSSDSGFAVDFGIIVFTQGVSVPLLTTDLTVFVPILINHPTAVSSAALVSENGLGSTPGSFRRSNPSFLRVDLRSR